MGNRRIGRKRLYGVEKAGQRINLDSGAGMKDNIKSASQHRQGQELITEIAVDLQGLTCAASDKGIIGHASKPSYITQLTEANYGIVTEIRVVVAETITNTADDIGAEGVDVEVGDGAAGIANNTGGSAYGGGTRVALTHDVRVKGADASATKDANELADGYLYVVNAESATSDTMTAGKLLIYIHGFVAPADI